MKASKKSLFISFSIINLIWVNGAIAVAPYRPPCENEAQKLEDKRTEFEQCMAVAEASDEAKSKEANAQCANKFTEYSKAIDEQRSCHDHALGGQNAK